MNINAKPIYPVEPWKITENGWDTEHNYRNETTFALSNGYIGTRGTFEEEYDFDIDNGLEGNFINGFYESEPIRYGECCFGFPEKSQTMLNVINAKPIKLFIGDEIFDMRKGKVESFCRTLHMDKGIVSRDVTWVSPNGNKIALHTERIVSFEDKHLMAILYEVTPQNFIGKIMLSSQMNCNVENHTRVTNPLIDYGPYGKRLFSEKMYSENGKMYVKSRTQNTKLAISCLCEHSVSTDFEEKCKTDDERCYCDYIVDAKENEKITFTKYIAYTTSQDGAEDEMEAVLSKSIGDAKEKGFSVLRKNQEDYMKSFWNTADIGVLGDDSLEQGLRFNLFHIMQSAGRDGRTGMGAKGLSGEGYEGHYFWDTEMYILPVFIYTFPDIAKSILNFRYNTLDKARERARIMGHPNGALFPWRTINGTEASSYYPLGTAQYHINGDISHAFQEYVDATGDYDYLAEKGAEVIFETARVYADVGSFVESKGGKYCICCVTGPDEYNALVDNNFYTNLMARENIRDALNALDFLKKNRFDDYTRLVEKLHITKEETELFQKIVDNMYFPYDEKLKVYPQDDGFEQRKHWDESKIPVEKRHLLYENYHPLFVFRHRMCKQADAILGMFLYDNLFTKEELKRNFDYYQTVTLHHSSLSTCIFGMLACKIGYTDLAYTYFSQSARMDLDDYHENFYAGIHAANMAGTFLSIVKGFAGMRTHNGKLSFSPFLPKKWKGYTFSINYHGSTIEVKITDKNAQYVLSDGNPVTFTHCGKKISLTSKGELHNEAL